MREGLKAVTKVTQTVSGKLSNGYQVRYVGVSELGDGLRSVFASVTKDERQVMTVSHNREGAVSYNFSRGEDFGKWEPVIPEMLADMEDMYAAAIGMDGGNEGKVTNN